MSHNPFLFETEFENENNFESFEDEFEFEFEDEFEDYEDEFRRAGIPRRFTGQSARIRPRPQFANRRNLQSRPRISARPQTVFGLRPARRRFPVAYPIPYLSGFSNSFPKSNEYIRLLQKLLNRVLGINLPTDGVMDVGTRSAIRSFAGNENIEDDGSNQTSSDQSQTDSEEMFFEFENNFALERETPRTVPVKYVKGFAGDHSDCATALTMAGKTSSEALRIINTQIGRAIRMLRIAAKNLQRGKRSAKTRELFLKIFRVTPEFVPTWLKQTDAIKDRGDVVAYRCRKVADLLEKGALRYFCTIRKKYCPDCSDGSTAYACSSWGKHRVICLNAPFWEAMKNNDIANVLAVLMHEPFHIYFGKYVTEHSRKGESVGKFGGIYCILQFVFEINSVKYPKRIETACNNAAVRN